MEVTQSTAPAIEEPFPSVDTPVVQEANIEPSMPFQEFGQIISKEGDKIVSAMAEHSSLSVDRPAWFAELEDTKNIGVDTPSWAGDLSGDNLDFPVPEISPRLFDPSEFADSFAPPPQPTDFALDIDLPQEDPSNRFYDAWQESERYQGGNGNESTNAENNGAMDSRKSFDINIKGSGKIDGGGLSKDAILELLVVNIKPILLKIIQTEIYEEGDYSYVY